MSVVEDLFPRPAHRPVGSRSPAPAYGNEEFSDFNGALKLKLRIEEYWRKRGKDVSVQMVNMGFLAKTRCAYYALRSNTVNGLPAKDVRPSSEEQAA